MSVEYDQAQAALARQDTAPSQDVELSLQLIGAFERGDGALGILPGDAARVAASLALRAAQAGDARGMWVFGMTLCGRTPPMSDAFALNENDGLAWLLRACEAGDRRAVTDTLGVAFHARTPEGAAWQERVAAMGEREIAEGRAEPAVYRLLGYYRFGGRGGEQDHDAARALMEIAAERGDLDAHFELYIYNTQGIGGPVDPEGALRHTVTAAEGGHTRAQANLGGFYATGTGVPQDMDLAVQWYDRAARGGEARAAHVLAQMYRRGQGVKRNRKLAKEYAELAEQLAEQLD